MKRKLVFTLFGVTGMLVLFFFIGIKNVHSNPPGKDAEVGIKFPALPYAYAALEPCIDAKTVEIHYDRHFRNYYNGFVAALAKDGINEMDVPKIIEKISSYSMAIRNNGGGFYNHLLYFENMSSGNVTMPDSLSHLLIRDFGSVAKFREQFNTAAKGVFGSGWAWLCVDKNGKLFVTTTPNQDNPLMDIVKDQGVPLLALDVWEHAYYLQYQNKRADYIQSFMSIINWNIVLQRYLNR